MIAIDPGSERSAMLWYFGDQPQAIGISMLAKNSGVLAELRTSPYLQPLVIEMVACYGMPVGREVFETVRWIGRFTEAWESRGGQVEYVYRKDIKLALCGTARAKDPNVRQALIDRFGGPASIKKGGPLHGITKDLWSALAVAVAWSDLGVRENSSDRRAGRDLVGVKA